jgi:single-strand DNA-binding protein
VAGPVHSRGPRPQAGRGPPGRAAGGRTLGALPVDQPPGPALEVPVHEPHVTVVGNVAAPPRLRTTQQGVPVADFRVAATPRVKDRTTGEWGDGETLWFGVTAWRALGEHAAASLAKGDRVVVTGRLTSRSWEVEGGEKRSGLEVEASSVGLELSRGTATYVRGAAPAADEDPWASSGHVDPDTGEVTGAVPAQAAPAELVGSSAP